MRGRARRRRAWVLALLGSFASCLPPEKPYWVIDHTDALMLRFEVAARGPYGQAPPATGGIAAEAMPGDRVRVTPVIAGLDGLVDVSALSPRWFACGEGLCSSQPFDAAELPACDGLELPPAELCALGEGAPFEFEVGELHDVLVALTRGAPILMVSGTPGGPTTGECLRRLARLDQASASLRDCIFLAEALRIGPTWRVPLVAAASGAELPLSPDRIPWQASQVEVDVIPEIDRITAWVPAPGGGEYFRETESGGTLVVKAGDALRLAAVPRMPEQTYAVLSIDQDNGDVSVSEVSETQTAVWFSTADAPFEVGAELGEVTWIAPDEPGPVFVYVLLGDGRSADAAWLRVEVED